MLSYPDLRQKLQARPYRWLVTGGAGFIGSHLVQTLTRLGQNVTILDNLSTGRKENIHNLDARFVEGDLFDAASCDEAVRGADFVLHQGGLGSVPRSIDNPLLSHRANVDGFINMLLSARAANVRAFVYASSSSVYGDDIGSPKVESRTGNVLSPYAATKVVDELYADVFARVYGMKCIGLRYFNVFGPRQNPAGAYAAVIPKWIQACLGGEEVHIYGDGETSRDFCYVENVVQANLLACFAFDAPGHEAINISCGQTTSLNQLFEMIRTEVGNASGRSIDLRPIYRDFRPGDIRNSHADISKAADLLGYRPTHFVSEGLNLTVRHVAATM